MAQNVTIRGKAHLSHAGKVINLFTYQDFITQIKFKETSDTIEKDGFFELKFYSGITQPVFLKIDNYIAKLHVKPDYVYGVIFPEIDEQFKYYNNAEFPVSLSLVGHDTSELNMLILDYEELFTNVFTSESNEFLTHRKLFRRADSLKELCDKRYAKINDSYFKNYYTYHIAGINASLSRGEKYLIRNYIIEQKIQYKNYEYMSFFSTCFANYLNSMASSKKGISLYQIINKNASLEQLHDFCKGDLFLKNDSLRELVILKNMWDLYSNPEFDQESIAAIVSKLNLQTKNEHHKELSDYMLKDFFQMKTGSPAPNFLARNKIGTIESFNKTKGQWVYLNFFSTKNNESLREMSKINLLRKKFTGKVIFISVSLDDSVGNYLNFLKQNPKYDWPIWHYEVSGIKNNARSLYNVIGSEAYFLINNQGALALSPALSPSKGIEFKLNAIFKPARKTTKTGIR